MIQDKPPMQAIPFERVRCERICVSPKLTKSVRIVGQADRDEIPYFDLFYAYGPERSDTAYESLPAEPHLKYFPAPNFAAADRFVVRVSNIHQPFDIKIDNERSRTGIASIDLGVEKASKFRHHVDDILLQFIKQHPSIEESESCEYEGVLFSGNNNLVTTIPVTNADGDWKLKIPTYQWGNPCTIDPSVRLLVGRRISSIHLELKSIRKWKDKIRVTCQICQMEFSM